MKASHFSPDIQEFIGLLWKHRVRYVIVGGEAVIYYGHARLTGDVDFFYDAAAKNIAKLYEALLKFWKGSIPGVRSAKDFATPGTIIQFGIPPNRIDLINSITKVTFAEAWKSKQKEKIRIKNQECPVYFIGLKQLIRNKEAIQRHKDFEDLKYLRSAAKKSQT